MSKKYLEAALGSFMDLVKSMKNHNLLSKTAIFDALQLINMIHNVSQCSYSKLKTYRKTVDKCPVPGLTLAYLCENSLFAKTQAKMVLKIEKKNGKKMVNLFLF